ncbi:MAG: bifunctional folylpolyglutamate synthase/dihydrofolate synthase [Microcoleaceae cyanobacterium]
MDIDTFLQKFLQKYDRFGVHLGLERIQILLGNLRNPHHQVPIIHVAGTNGKGSVCAYLSAGLAEAGYRVGRYTSPHLIDWTERICLNQQPISSQELQRILLEVERAIVPNEPSPTQFEVITAAAWLYFAQQQVDLAVIEVGLGGRLDATNVCDRPLATVITSLSREHWQRLGPTLADIAREKAGILKPNCPAIIGELPPEAQAVVERRITDLNCPVTWVKPAMAQAESYAFFDGIEYPLPLLGEIQLMNSALAIATLRTLQHQGWPISDTAIQQGMAKTCWPGRIQWTTWGGFPVLIDGAHNPAAAQALSHYVNRLRGSEGSGSGFNPTFCNSHPESVTWVMGMLSTKDHADIFQALLQRGDRLHLVPVPDHSSADPPELARLALQICPELDACQAHPGLTVALETACSQDQGLTVLCGSLYLIGHFLKVRV